MNVEGRGSLYVERRRTVENIIILSEYYYVIQTTLLFVLYSFILVTNAYNVFILLLIMKEIYG